MIVVLICRQVAFFVHGWLGEGLPLGEKAVVECNRQALCSIKEPHFSSSAWRVADMQLQCRWLTVAESCLCVCVCVCMCVCVCIMEQVVKAERSKTKAKGDQWSHAAVISDQRNKDKQNTRQPLRSFSPFFSAFE